MPRVAVVNECAVARTPRVLQLEGLFDLPPAERSARAWEIDLPLDDRPWNVGLIVGPSGSGKSTVARAAFGDRVVHGFAWPEDRSLVDGFPAALGVKEIASWLSSVGLASPPTWLRPFVQLSTGEQFRATLARALAEACAESALVAIDEFTSVVDRTVAQIGSAAAAKAVRKRGLRFVAVTCHYDVVDWLQPDWQCEPATGSFSWRSLRPRPQIALDVRRTDAQAWRLFHHHHYLNAALHPAARCFLGSVSGRPAAFAAVLPFPHPTRPGWREHRVVCLPDFQGVGIGNALSEYVASLFTATGKPYRSVTGNPAMIAHRARSPVWRMTRPPSCVGVQHARAWRKTSAARRITASFEYVGPPRPREAVRFGVR